MKKIIFLPFLLMLIAVAFFAAPLSAEEPVVITWVDKRAEFADLTNRGQNAQNLAGWQLVSEHGNQRCPLSGTLQAGARMRVFAQTGTAANMQVFNCEFDTTIWNNSEVDPAVLCNAENVEVSRYPAGASNPSSEVPACNNPPVNNPPSGGAGEPCPSSGAWPPGCVPNGGGSQPNPPAPPSSGSGEPCPATGKWPPGCVPNGGGGTAPPPSSGGGDDCVIPDSGPWPPCATGGGGSTSPTPPASGGGGQPCPPSGAWPPGCVPPTSSEAPGPPSSNPTFTTKQQLSQHIFQNYGEIAGHWVGIEDVTIFSEEDGDFGNVVSIEMDGQNSRRLWVDSDVSTGAMTAQEAINWLQAINTDATGYYGAGVEFYVFVDYVFTSSYCCWDIDDDNGCYTHLGYDDGDYVFSRDLMLGRRFEDGHGYIRMECNQWLSVKERIEYERYDY